MASRKTCGDKSLPVVRLALETDRCIRKPQPTIVTPDDVARLVSAHYACKPQEFFLVIHLGSNGEVLQVHEVAMGALDSTSVDPRIVFAGALTAGARGIIIVHNHPSGNTEPSTADVALTKQLKIGAEAVGIVLQDHIIIPRGGGYTSFRARGLL